YVVRLHELDDSGARGDGIGSLDPDDVVDSLEDEQLNNSGLPTQVFLDAKTGLFLPATIWDRAVADAEQFGWRGPYVNFHRKYKNDGLTPIVWVGGAPLDPWGNPYFLFVPN